MDINTYTSCVLLAIYDDEINYHYLKRYIKLICHYKKIEPQGKRKKGFERHHIFPNNRCSEKFSKDPNNLVLLPAKAHFVAHHLLYKAFPKNNAMMFAFRGFVYGHGKERKNLRITSRVFEKLKLDYTNNSFAQTEIGRKKCSETALNQLKNGNHPSQIKKYCRYCNKEFDSPNYARFHGKECLENPKNFGVKRTTKPHTVERKERTIQTNIERFGVGSYFQTEEFIEANKKRLNGRMTVFDLELRDYVRIPKEEYHSNRNRFFNLNSKVYKDHKLKEKLWNAWNAEFIETEKI